MNKLFMAVLGGNCGNSNIEVHDVRFVIGNSIDACIPELRRQWFGDAKGLHLDSYTEITHAQGFDVTVSNQPSQSPERLYFVNVGGYRAGKCLEFHDIGLFVASNEATAKKHALASLLSDHEQTHRDDVYAVDDCLELHELAGQYIQLTPSSESIPLKPSWYGYRPIDKD